VSVAVDWIGSDDRQHVTAVLIILVMTLFVFEDIAVPRRSIRPFSRLWALCGRALAQLDAGERGHATSGSIGGSPLPRLGVPVLKAEHAFVVLEPKARVSAFIRRSR
jgi:hypothetical protein